MELMRVSGNYGIQIYDSNIFTEADATEDYTDQTGGEHSEIQYMKFDALSSGDLTKFIKRGNT